MSVTISLERPDSAEAVELIAELQAHLESFYPPESRHGFSVERLVAEEVAFFVLRVDGEAAGCGGIKLIRGCDQITRGTVPFCSADSAKSGQSPEYGEIMRMYVRPRFRSRGLGKMILDRLAEHSREHGITLLRLETGIHQQSAIRLYERAGFRRIPPFGPYRDDPLSLCYEKKLACS